MFIISGYFAYVLGTFYICVLYAAFYLHSYGVLNESMLIVRDEELCSKNASIDRNK